ncbi:MAG TPA: ERF family protein [Gemmatimonadales bacterium]|nr:ERF family protein [Gemmatimonadales bacterium]
MNVYECIAAVSAELAQIGIAKSRKNAQQGYSFRGIDEVFNALAPLLAKHHLVVLPRMLSRAVTERETQKGGVLFNVVVEAEFDFVSAKDGSKHVVRMYGEAMDSADKATNKAMSAAYKYAAFQTFCIPTEGDNDADATTPEPVRSRQSDAVGSESAPPEGFDNWYSDLTATADLGLHALEQTWKASRADLRRYLLETRRANWEALKARAATVTSEVPV